MTLTKSTEVATYLRCLLSISISHNYQVIETFDSRIELQPGFTFPLYINTLKYLVDNTRLGNTYRYLT